MVVWIATAFLVGATLALYLPTSSATRPVGPVTIETFIDFTSPPFSGTFEVPEGASILGCSSGTFVDTPLGSIKKEFTCTDGAGSGDTFAALFEPWVGFVSGGNADGHWRVVEGTGFFASLRGRGDFSLEPLDLDGDGSIDHGIETLTGKVHFDP